MRAAVYPLVVFLFAFAVDQCSATNSCKYRQLCNGAQHVLACSLKKRFLRSIFSGILKMPEF